MGVRFLNPPLQLEVKPDGVRASLLTSARSQGVWFESSDFRNDMQSQGETVATPLCPENGKNATRLRRNGPDESIRTTTVPSLKRVPPTCWATSGSHERDSNSHILRSERSDSFHLVYRGVVRTGIEPAISLRTRAPQARASTKIPPPDVFPDEWIEHSRACFKGTSPRQRDPECVAPDSNGEFSRLGRARLPITPATLGLRPRA
jgi:hypothetical protein